MSESDLIENVTYDELHIGQSATLQRTLTNADIQAFALVSGDVNPAHVDPAYANGTRFHGVIVHGMFAGALISTVLGTEFPGPGTIYMSQSLKFERPVRVGDTLTVKVTVRSKEDAHRNVVLDCEVSNQAGERVVSGEAGVRAPLEKVVRPRAHLPTMHLFEPEARLDAWIASLTGAPPLRCAVVHPCDDGSLRGALEAAEHGLIVPVLVGPRARLAAVAEAGGLSLAGIELVDTAHSHASAAQAVALAAEGKVAMLMKGSLHTDELMEAVVNEHRLRTERRMSHVFRFEVPAYAKPLLVTDAALNITPDLTAKADILRNVIDLAHALGVPAPKVALLSAVETVSPRIPSTVDAAALCKMADRGQITGAVLDGPLAFDNAISADAARIKGIVSPVAGQADILMVPDLEAGNMLAKQLEYLAGASSCGVVLGARVPIALTSRADTPTSRMASAALAMMAARSQTA
ncbi:bifunctional enoyl-CoA hydratase/phosphate acetyltransferase [Ideonella sp. B7]|uniref:bifunctional enoyl-CoA hydratase/phosphate acetyltransferase n=1 Tax=Ideonella benzenivorans TaxID=2831643 RepID=UPI001CEC2911|nr:bifunctional enoyl-CoA hydratase/phosphate acetyltransferase [Ideonella benzenivorans]MCA6215178.1 bifunctional enoyl-CoA hydratase/phosphate acetyltransferase [Ideonella benzenivorans]